MGSERAGQWRCRLFGHRWRRISWRSWTCDRCDEYGATFP